MARLMTCHLYEKKVGEMSISSSNLINETSEKVMPVILYTRSAMLLGDVKVVSQIRVSTWLKTSSAPDIVQLQNAKVIHVIGSTPSKPNQFPEIHIPKSEIQAMHLLPTATEPLDYDAAEPNRRLLPVTVLFSSFRAEGSLWASMRADLAKFIELNREEFTSVYDVQITSPVFPTLPIIRVPMMICRSKNVLIAGR